MRAEGDKLLHGLQHQSQRSQSCCLASQPSCLPYSFPFSHSIISALCLMIVLLLVITFQTHGILFYIPNVFFRNFPLKIYMNFPKSFSQSASECFMLGQNCIFFLFSYQYICDFCAGFWSLVQNNFLYHKQAGFKFHGLMYTAIILLKPSTYRVSKLANEANLCRLSVIRFTVPQLIRAVGVAEASCIWAH